MFYDKKRILKDVAEALKQGNEMKVTYYEHAETITLGGFVNKQDLWEIDVLKDEIKRLSHTLDSLVDYLNLNQENRSEIYFIEKEKNNAPKK